MTQSPDAKTDGPAEGRDDALRLMVVGLGMMGRAAAAVAVAELPLAHLHLVDVDQGRARAVADELARHGVPVTAGTSWQDGLGSCDVALLALHWPQTEQFLAETRHSGLGVVSITRPPVSPEPYVPEVVRERTGPAVLPVGLEPGLTEILLGHAVRGLDRVHAVETLCGGLTTQPPDGFPYRLLFGGTTLPFTQRPAFALDSGRRRTLERFSAVRPASLPGLPSLESYHDGMVPWLCELPGLDGADVEQRSVRWPGFVSAVALLRAGGLLDEDDIEVAGTKLTPRRVTDEIVGRKLQRGSHEREVTHLQLTAHGVAGGREVTRRINIWCRDDETPLDSGMACMTAVPAVVAAGLVAGHPGGWRRPEEIFDTSTMEVLFTALERHGAHIRDRFIEGEPT
ncbi:saccharopine dehydrogenase family protein [Streptomyces cyaneus]|uniref:saccharopine dehydrogenase family protein n=1 Tax=Streptomyces cyaneus TaxID=1904 RepID=UPI000FF88158|nr:saccharopine dehydrogenase C-terminal domain-containing protein [Streptomyces cyaneus]